MLSGDRNLMANGVPLERTVVRLKTSTVVRWSQSMHKQSGNIAGGDGSVQQTSQTRLQELVQRAADSGSSLVFP